MAPLHFNWVVIVVAGIINFAIGGLWYAQPVFGRHWVAAICKQPRASALAASGGTTLMAAILLAAVISWTGASNVGEGLLVAGIGWLAFAWTSGVANAIFEPQPRPPLLHQRGIPVGGVLDHGRHHCRVEVADLG